MKNIIGNNNGDAYINHLNVYMNMYEINTLPRIQFFIAIACGETGGFSKLDENLNYKSIERIKTVFSNINFGNEDLSQYVGNPELLANRVYGGRFNNNPPPSQDGWDFRGGGLFQLTFRGNYEAFAKAINEGANPPSPIIKAEHLAIENYEGEHKDYYIRKHMGAVKSACHYVKSRGVLPEADKNTEESFIAACKKVGRCPDGNNYKKKRDYWIKCKTFIGGNGIVGNNNTTSTENTRLNFLTSFDLNVFLDAKQRIGNN